METGMIKFIVPHISGSGHLYNISIEFNPYAGKWYSDPCTKKCYELADKEYEQIAKDIKAGLKLLWESRMK